MSDQTPAASLKQLWSLYRARREMVKGKLDSARRRLDNLLALGEQSIFFTLALASKALLEIEEGRSEAAKSQFSRCLEKASLELDARESYIACYCRLYLSIYDESLGFSEIEKAGLEAHAALADAPRFARMILPLAPMKKLEEICGHRKAENNSSSSLDGIQNRSRVSIQFGF